MRYHREDRTECPDYSSRAGAEQLAEQLTAFWHARGYRQVQFWVEPLHEPRCRHITYVVRGNLVRGLPPKAEATL